MAITDCPQGAWTKVETGISEGIIHRLDYLTAEVLFCTVDTAGAAPTLISEGSKLFGSLSMGGASAKDVYMWPIGAAAKFRSTKIA